MAPVPGRVTVAVAALDDEAAIWSGSATVLRGARDAVAVLALDESALSWASRSTGLLDTYAALRRKAQRLLAEGAGTLDALANDLRAAADAYRRAEQHAVQRTRGVR